MKWLFVISIVRLIARLMETQFAVRMNFNNDIFIKLKLIINAKGGK